MLPVWKSGVPSGLRPEDGDWADAEVPQRGRRRRLSDDPSRHLRQTYRLPAVIGEGPPAGGVIAGARRGLGTSDEGAEGEGWRRR